MAEEQFVRAERHVGEAQKLVAEERAKIARLKAHGEYLIDCFGKSQRWPTLSAKSD